MPGTGTIWHRYILVSQLTTFVTKFGQYHYKNSPQVYLSSNDSYTYRYSNIVQHIKDKAQCVGTPANGLGIIRTVLTGMQSIQMCVEEIVLTSTPRNSNSVRMLSSLWYLRLFPTILNHAKNYKQPQQRCNIHKLYHMFGYSLVSLNKSPILFISPNS